MCVCTMKVASAIQRDQSEVSFHIHQSLVTFVVPFLVLVLIPMQAWWIVGVYYHIK